MTASNFERRTVGRYELLSLLGEGGAANTYAARDTTNDQRLAVKELRLLKASNTKQIELFERECAILRELDHPQIPRFIDNVVERRPETISLYLIQELVVGRSLQQWLDEGRRFSPAETVDIMQSCLEPLQYLHDRTPPLFHRDIKPSNVIQRPDGSCVLVDFGAVREAILEDRGRGSSVVGTFGYMAPEQFQARAYPATDLYGLAATTLHLLTGIEPGRFPLKRLKPEIQRHLRTDPHLTAILDILLEPTPEDRYANVGALCAALDRWTDTHGDDPAVRELAQVLPTESPEVANDEVTVAVADDVATPDDSGDTPALDPEVPSAVPGVPQDRHSSPRLTVEDLAEFAERERLPPPMALLADASATPPPTRPIADRKQELAPATSGVRVPVITERSNAAESLLPGGLGAREVGPAIAVLGIGALAYARFSSLEYNQGAWFALGAVLAIYGVLLAISPRRAVSRGTSAARSGNRAGAQVRRIVKRVGILGGSMWVVEYAFEADDELHYSSQFLLPSAKAAKEVALAPESVHVRYAPHDPEDSVLVLPKA